MVHTRLDAKGLLCPLPVLRTRKALKLLAAGDTLAVEATDAASPADFAAFCAATGDILRLSEQRDGIYHFEIVKAPAADS